MRLRVPLEHEANRPNKMAVALTGCHIQYCLFKSPFENFSKAPCALKKTGRMMMMMEKGKAIPRR